MIAIPAGFTPQEYLSLERQHTVRHEYRRGLVYAMAGGSDDHSSLAVNLVTEINVHLRGSGCRVLSSDVKVNYAEDFYYYPDVFVTCEPRDDSDRYIKRYPKMICEVLSTSTQKFDRTEKFNDYKLIDTLEEYVLVSQDQMRVECFRLQPDKSWQLIAFERGEIATFKSIGLEVCVEELYRGTSVK
ncbi:MAG: Uma2 family endonuclease [Phormidesmis sp.]